MTSTPDTPGLPRVYDLELPWAKPPLNANQRLHWRAKARMVKAVRRTAWALARNAKIPACAHIRVWLVYQPRDSRRRDPSNLMPTQKPSLDGLVDAGIVPDDTPEYVTESIPRIVPPVSGQPGKLWLHVEAWPAA